MIKYIFAKETYHFRSPNPKNIPPEAGSRQRLSYFYIRTFVLKDLCFGLKYKWFRPSPPPPGGVWDKGYIPKKHKSFVLKTYGPILSLVFMPNPSVDFVVRRLGT